jgi:hypothetical protein
LSLKHAIDPRVVQAVLGAPSFLSGLSAAEIGVVRSELEQRLAPEVASLKAETTKALGMPNRVGGRRYGK